MFRGIDLSSDTATRPTQEMKNAMVAAEVGDEQRKEDPTTNALEEKAANLLGFSSAIFLPSATMANQIAIALHCEAGDELIAAENSHVISAETGGPAVHARALCKPIVSENGLFTVDKIIKKHRTIQNVRYPELRLISIENTTNLGGGYPWEIKDLKEIVNYAKKSKIKLHMDGARLFNASVKTGLIPKEIVAGFDTVTLCLSKGLGCPAGALLVFDKANESKVNKLKHLMGGALRQSGILAAAGIYALNNHISRLKIDHENAAFLAEKLNELHPIIQISNVPVPTNIIIFNWNSNKISSDEFHQHCINEGFRFSRIGLNQFRAVTHLDISRNQISEVIRKVKNMLETNEFSTKI